MYKGFDEEGFMRWLESEYDICRFARMTVSSLIEYAHKHEQVSKDQFADFLSDILPEVEFIDVVRFCENNILTDETVEWVKRIDFDVKCFERDLIIELKNPRDREKAKKIISEAYDKWCEQPEEVGDMCCEEYICETLKNADIDFKWINE